MHPIEHIRKNVLKLNQADFAVVAGVTQPTVSRWENNGLEPNRNELARIRDEVRKRSLNWNDEWFFKSPSVELEPESARSAE